MEQKSDKTHIPTRSEILLQQIMANEINSLSFKELQQDRQNKGLEAIPEPTLTPLEILSQVKKQIRADRLMREMIDSRFQNPDTWEGVVHDWPVHW